MVELSYLPKSLCWPLRKESVNQRNRMEGCLETERWPLGQEPGPDKL